MREREKRKGEQIRHLKIRNFEYQKKKIIYMNITLCYRIYHIKSIILSQGKGQKIIRTVRKVEDFISWLYNNLYKLTCDSSTDERDWAFQ